jgi:osmotically-inducible protein OsmY
MNKAQLCGTDGSSKGNGSSSSIIKVKVNNGRAIMAGTVRARHKRNDKRRDKGL